MTEFKVISTKHEDNTSITTCRSVGDTVYSIIKRIDGVIVSVEIMSTEKYETQKQQNLL